MSRWRAARRGIVLAMGCALLLLGGLSFVRRASAVEPLTGIAWIQSARGPLVLRVDPRSPAAASGLREGDLLLEVQGRAVRSALEAAALAWNAREGQELELVVRRNGAPLELSLAADWRPRPEPYAYLALVGLAFWASGLLVALRWPRIRGGILYPLLAATLFGYLVFSHTGRADVLDWTIYWLDVIAGAFAPALLLHVAVVLTRRAIPFPRAWIGIAYAIPAAIVLAAVWLSPSAGGGAYRLDAPISWIEALDRLSILLLAISLLATVVLCVRSWVRSPSAMHRSQSRWLLWGVGVGLGPFVLLYAVPWALGADDLPAWAQFLAVLPMLLVPAAFTASLARYRLHDLDVLLLRGLWEVGAIFGTFAVLAAAVFLMREGLDPWLPLSHAASRYVGFLLAAVAYPQLRSWMRSAVERAFYRRRYSYRATLLDWARELNAETDLPSLLDHLRRRVRETLDVPEAEVFLRTGPSYFAAAGAEPRTAAFDLDPGVLARLESEASVPVGETRLASIPWAAHLFPLRVKGRLRALLAIAEREAPDEPLTSEDRALLGTLTAHAASAIEAARLVQEVRRRVEEVERLHARQEQILESSAVGLLLLDGDGRILAWNRALEGLYGLARDEAVGRRIGDVFPLHVARRIEREGQASQDESARFRLTLVNRAASRRVVNIAISAAGDGGRVVTFDDVTDRVKLEEQVLQQERLAALGLLAAGVAHEINTPLTGISSYAQLLLEDSAPADPRRASLEKIETQAARASSIANSLLNLARPERTAFEPLDLNDAVREALQLFEPQIRRGPVHLVARLGEGLPQVRGHRGKLQQVLLNLLLNARDAIEEGGRIRVATYCEESRVIVEVRDDGVGIPDEDLPRIFDPFFTTKGRGNGTGLGLSISYGIVQEHDGTIQVDSRAGAGTRFRIDLPASRSARAMA